MAVDLTTAARWQAEAKDETAELLESLLAHPGWQLFASAVHAEWQQRELNGRETALNEPNDTNALNLLRQVTAAQRAVEWALNWPTQELHRRLRMTDSRDGGPTGTAPVLHGMSRRGHL